MAQFLHEDVKRLLHYKFVVIIGDSVQRGIYKDLINLLQTNRILSGDDLKAKGEASFMNDTLVDGGTKGVMHNGIDYKEVREYRTQSHLVRFYFVTRVRNRYWLDVIFPALGREPRPDVVVINSCLWDISRYGLHGMKEYCENLTMTFRTLKTIVPSKCICIWNTALPVSNRMKGGFLPPGMVPYCAAIRTDVIAANYYARQQAEIFNVDVLDLHYRFQLMTGMQEADGIHWNEVAHRIFTNVMLSHISKSWSSTVNYDLKRHSDMHGPCMVPHTWSLPVPHPQNQTPVVNSPRNVPRNGWDSFERSPRTHDVQYGIVNQTMGATNCQIVDFPKNVPRNERDLFKERRGHRSRNTQGVG